MKTRFMPSASATRQACWPPAPPKQVKVYSWVICHVISHSECPLTEGILTCHATDMSDFMTNDPLGDVIAALDRDLLDGVRHVLDRDLQEALRHFLRRAGIAGRP